jgi:hypothetical protein
MCGKNSRSQEIVGERTEVRSWEEEDQYALSCDDEGIAGNCGPECRVFLSGECPNPPDEKEYYVEDGTCWINLKEFVKHHE